MLAGEFSSRWIWYKIPYMCIIARASTNRMILFGLIAAVGCGMLVFADKVITTEDSKQIKEWIMMTKVGLLFE